MENLWKSLSEQSAKDNITRLKVVFRMEKKEIKILFKKKTKVEKNIRRQTFFLKKKSKKIQIQKLVLMKGVNFRRNERRKMKQINDFLFSFIKEMRKSN